MSTVSLSNMKTLLKVVIFHNKIDVDDKTHKFFPGNHDNYDTCFEQPGCLGDFGKAHLGGVQFFFIRGAFSIDGRMRTDYEMKTGFKCRWNNEQLMGEEIEKAYDEYKRVCPDIMITHSCPTAVGRNIGSPKTLQYFGYDSKTFNTNTQTLLEKCHKFHQPKLWIFGHFHRSVNIIMRETRFICLAELECIDIDKDGKILRDFP